MGLLSGLRIVEFAGQGPAPFCAMLLADHGAEVIRIERAGGLATLNTGRDPIRRKRHNLTLDLKNPTARDLAFDIISDSNALIEGHRPGVMERLGLGPDICLERQPALVYGRVTGWGQSGPLSQAPGRDINYVGLSGALAAIGSERPTPPLNLVGDYGGGGMLLAFGLVAALVSAGRTGKGCVLDAAMLDGAALLMTSVMGLRANGQWRDQPSANVLDGGAPFYRTYECADGKWIAVGALEARSMGALLKMTSLAELFSSDLRERAEWPELERRLGSAFKRRSRDEWARHPDAQNACVTPVLTMAEAPHHSHNAARGVFANETSSGMPNVAPRISSARGDRESSDQQFRHEAELLRQVLGWPSERVSELEARGIVQPAPVSPAASEQ
jgi:alpha-methylacyl-CoA racemase